MRVHRSKGELLTPRLAAAGAGAAAVAVAASVAVAGAVAADIAGFGCWWLFEALRTDH